MSPQQAATNFLQVAMENPEKWKILIFGLQLEEQEESYCDETNGEMIVTHRATNVPLTKSACGPFLPCFAYQKLGDAGRTRVGRKIRKCSI